MSNRPIERWLRLRSSSEGDGQIEVPSFSSGVDTGFGPVRFAIGPKGQPRLMVPCGSSVSLRERPSDGNLIVTLSRYDVAGRKTLFIDVMCTASGLDPVFAELADEIVHRIEEGKGPVEAVESTIDDFQDLLRGGNRQDVADEQILGLIGELLVLRRLAHMSPRAAEAWTGPYEQRHDFRRSERAIEVKTSSRSDSTLVRISSCEQLSEPAGGSLVLVHVKVERADHGDLSVSKLFSDVVAAGASRQATAEGLAAIGCVDPDAHEWNRLRYAFEGMTGYLVGPGFPRITAAQFPDSTLPRGIQSVVYSVDLRAAKEFLLTESALARELEMVIS
jgi:hypothetical protein